MEDRVDYLRQMLNRTPHQSHISVLWYTLLVPQPALTPVKMIGPYIWCILVVYRQLASTWALELKTSGVFSSGPEWTILLKLHLPSKIGSSRLQLEPQFRTSHTTYIHGTVIIMNSNLVEAVGGGCKFRESSPKIYSSFTNYWTSVGNSYCTIQVMAGKNYIQKGVPEEIFSKMLYLYHENGERKPLPMVKGVPVNLGYVDLKDLGWDFIDLGNLRRI